MSDERPISERREDPLLLRLKDHVVQIEMFLVLIIFSIVVLQLVTILAQSGQLRIPVWLIGPVLLASMKPLMRVNNPTGPLKNAMVWGATLGGWVGGVSGAAADILSGGLTGGQGTLIGIAGEQRQARPAVTGSKVGRIVVNCSSAAPPSTTFTRTGAGARK